MLNASRLPVLALVALSSVSVLAAACASPADDPNDEAAEQPTSTNEALSASLGNLETATGWTTCSTSGTNCGGAGGTGTPVQSTFTPGTFGGRANAAKLWVGGNVSYGTAYWYRHAADVPALVSGVDYITDFFIPLGTSFQAIEWDSQQTHDHLVYNFGWQANPISKQWRMFNYAAGRWEDSGIAWADPQQGVWHHFHAHYHVSGTKVFHDWMELDGVRHVPTKNAVHDAAFRASYGGSSFNVGLQLDQRGSGAAYAVYWDNVTLEYTDAASTPGTGACSAPAILEPTAQGNVGPAIHLRTSAASCITSTACYVDAQPTPVATGSGAIDAWVSVSMGAHTAQCNGWDASGTVHASPSVAFTRTY